MTCRWMLVSAACAVLALGCSDSSITEVDGPQQVVLPDIPQIPQTIPPILGTNVGYQVQGKIDIISPFPGAVNDVYQFTAKEFKGTVTGKFTYDTQLVTGPVHVEGEVACFAVVEQTINGVTVAKARLAGVVTQTNNILFPQGHVLFWNVTDGNKGTTAGVDSGSPLLGYPFAPSLHCTAGGFAPESPTLTGFVHITKIGN